MHKWHHIFSKSRGLNLYVWIAFCILPFYFVFRLSGPLEITIGLILIVLFFTAYRLAFLRKGWVVYASIGLEMVIHTVMTLYFGYVYFALFLAYYIGNSKQKAQFITLYIIHLAVTLAAVGFGFAIRLEMLLAQIPFIIITLIFIILFPLNMYHTNKQKELEIELHDANTRISELLVAEERHRIARDLHDTLGQKLSLIGMKSDLSGRLITVDTERAALEMKDIQQTARTALKELREIVSSMRSVKLVEEVAHVRQMLEAGEIQLELHGEFSLQGTPLLTENVLSMCLKEAVTNVVKHSKATTCTVTILQSSNEVVITISDDGVGLNTERAWLGGNGLRGISERLEFVNGQLTVTSGAGPDNTQGTTIRLQVPKVTMGTKKAAEEREE